MIRQELKQSLPGIQHSLQAHADIVLQQFLPHLLIYPRRQPVINIPDLHQPVPNRPLRKLYFPGIRFRRQLQSHLISLAQPLKAFRILLRIRTHQPAPVRLLYFFFLFCSLYPQNKPYLFFIHSNPILFTR